MKLRIIRTALLSLTTLSAVATAAAVPPAADEVAVEHPPPTTLSLNSTTTNINTSGPFIKAAVQIQPSLDSVPPEEPICTIRVGYVEDWVVRSFLRKTRRWRAEARVDPGSTGLFSDNLLQRWCGHIHNYVNPAIIDGEIAFKNFKRIKAKNFWFHNTQCWLDHENDRALADTTIVATKHHDARRLFDHLHFHASTNLNRDLGFLCKVERAL